MTVWETVLVFVVVPLGLFGLLALLTFGPGMSRAPRYRPGRGWDHDPVWYIARPDVVHPQSSPDGRAAITAGSGRAAPAAVLDAPKRTARGGASGEW